jgi:dipeptidyl aminopeptidase/acylaminoacyl peptidase
VSAPPGGPGTPRAFRADDVHLLRAVGDPQLSPDGGRVAFTVGTVDREEDRTRSQIWMVEVGGEARPYTSGDGDAAPRWSPDGATLGFLRPDAEGRPQVWALPAAGGEARQLTHAAVGVGEYAWAPDGSGLAYTAVVLPDGAAPGDPVPFVVRTLPAKVDGRGWRGRERVHLFRDALDGGDAVQLTEGDLDVQGIAWSPAGDRIAFVAGLDPRTAFAQDVCAVPAGGGALERLSDWDGLAQAVAWTPDGRALVVAGQAEWSTDRHTRLYRLDAAGGKPELLAPDLDRNVMLGGPGYPGARPAVVPDGSAVRFCIRDRGCVHVMLAPLDGGPATTLIGDEHRVVSGVTASASGSRLAYLVNDAATPGDVVVAAADGSGERQLTSMNAEVLAGLDVFTGRARTFATPAGEVHGWVLGPDDDEARPLLLDIHGGPHNAWGPGLDTAHLYHQVLAARGWRILLLNTPGSDGYGQEHFGALRGGWGRVDLPAFMAPVEQLVAEGLADADRLAVTGYSYGGYMTSWIVTQTDRFAAAVTGGCITNLVSAYGSMDLGPVLFANELGADLHEDVDRYVDLSPLTHADAVVTPTLILQGAADDRCPVEQAEELFSALLRRGRVETELVVYPGASHLFILNGRPGHRVDYNERVAAWVTRHAEPAPALDPAPAPEPEPEEKVAP